MRALRTISILAWVIACGCGPDGADEPAGTLSASLSVPRALADELTRVDVYVYRVSDGRPTQAELLAEYPLGSGQYTAYREFKEYKKVEIAFQTTTVAEIKGIPDRGPVWMFYARGQSATSIALGHGATAGPIRIQSNSLTDVRIEVRAFPQ